MLFSFSTLAYWKCWLFWQMWTKTHQNSKILIFLVIYIFGNNSCVNRMKIHHNIICQYFREIIILSMYMYKTFLSLRHYFVIPLVWYCPFFFLVFIMFELRNIKCKLHSYLIIYEIILTHNYCLLCLKIIAC